MKRTLCCLAVIAFLVGCIVLTSYLITPHYPQASKDDSAYSFDSKDELHDYVEDYIEEHYAADPAEAASQFDYLYDDGWRDGYDEGYRDGYQAGYEDGANGAEYWEP